MGAFIIIGFVIGLVLFLAALVILIGTDGSSHHKFWDRLTVWFIIGGPFIMIVCIILAALHDSGVIA